MDFSVGVVQTDELYNRSFILEIIRIKMSRLFLALGAINAFLCVLLGAIGAHILKQKFSGELFNTFQTGLQYHFYHALGLILIGVLLFHLPQSKLVKLSGWVMLTGILFFSGTLYIVSFTEMRSLGMVAPIGGLSLMSAWLILAYAIWSEK